MNSISRAGLFLLAGFCLAAAFVLAEVPQIINYQGRLTDALDNPASAAIKYLTLIIHYFIVFEQAFSGLEVSLLDLFLSLFDAFADSGVIYGLTFLPADPSQCLDSPFGRKYFHKVIVKAEEELG